MESRGIRDQIVVATKVRSLFEYLLVSTQLIHHYKQYTASYKMQNPSIKVKVNYVGANAKSLYISVEESLKKLRTSYIDLLYVHWWD